MLIFRRVADLGCLSRNPDPDFYPSRIPDCGSRILDPTTAAKEKGGKICCPTFFVAPDITKFKIIFFLNW
jgi:hypothetical protein